MQRTLRRGRHLVSKFALSRRIMPGFEYEFVAEVPREYMCPICECPMREPVQTKCGHRFCKRCLEKAMKSKRKCPFDRISLDERSAKDIYPDVATERTILDFVVKCPHEQNGCKWTGELRSIKAHESHCSFVGVKCTNKDCETTPLKKDLHHHVTKECPKRNVQCQHCGTLFVWCKRHGHFDECKKYPMVCLQKCGGPKIPRDKMNSHIEESCPHTKVESTFAHIGCKVKVQRKSLPDHLKGNTDSHLKLACERLQELQVSSTVIIANNERMQAEMVTAMKKIKEFSEAAERGEAVQDLRDKIALINKKLQDLQSKKDGYALSDGLSALRSEVVAIRIQMEALSETDEKLVELQEIISDLQNQIPKIANLQGLRGEVSGTSRKLQKLQETISRLEKQNSDLKNKTSYKHQEVLDKIEDVEWDLQNVHAISNSDRAEHQTRFNEQVNNSSANLKSMKEFMIFVALFSAMFVYNISTNVFARKEELTDLHQNFLASGEQIKQLKTDLFEQTHFLQDESTCKADKFVWSFSKFNWRFWEAKTGSQLCFFSEPFFVEPYGYKMHIAICPSGYPTQGTHLSVFASLLRSRNDDVLPWPFQQKVVFTLVDQQDDTSKMKNIKKAISPKKRPNLKRSFARPPKSCNMNTDSFGYNNFISHVDLYKRRYVRDDTILIQVEVYPLHCDG